MAVNGGARVLHVLSSLKVGGAERFVLDLSAVQEQAGDHVEVFSCSSEECALDTEASKQSLNCILSSGDRFRDYKAVWHYFRTKSSKSVLHIHSPFGLRFFVPLLPFLFLLGVRIVYTRHGIAPLASKKWRLIHRFANLFVSWVTFVSDAGKKAFYNTHGWKESKLVTISNGVFVPLQVANIESTKLRIGSVGRMVALKGQKGLINAVSRLDATLREKIEIHFFGDGPERSKLEALALEALNDGQCIFHGMELDRDKVYGSFDVLAVCSEQEGLSLAIMEAMARRIPVIATNVGDSPKLVLDDQTGFLYEYADVENLTKLITQLCEDDELRRSLGEKAREHMIENFSLESANEEYQKCYQG
ncbi:hypothetical protein A3752_06275 [Oleiphilus sp. HI0081]|nr:MULTISPECIES: glycosyltransferase family 4 protein [unclassified Oleiphilus]KZY78229.1 hypothetical protein A3740_08255 [Oleiphilus sp. HI0068]KZY80380.1 hypothetical protein A3741_05605 [Oleiphilus sp. HI0069]KZY87285.1 hypothetical protein A3743_14905 [Oleiphilus sp. HI0072]KZZ22498.1 hypothetical protein A3752_06275 [Oleiphilus sp. HI0081]KZZ46832.1 hypothetical protein A3755_17540 [Oleiphilus sp. HI0085]